MSLGQHWLSVIVLSALCLVNSHLRISINGHWWVLNKGVLLGVFSFGYRSCLCALAFLSLHIMEPHLQWRDLNGMTRLRMSSFFKADRADRSTSVGTHSRPSPGSHWRSRRDAREQISKTWLLYPAVCYTDRSKGVNTAFYDIMMAKLFVSTLVMV